LQGDLPACRREHGNQGTHNLRRSVAILDQLCRYIEIPFEYEYFSEVHLDLEQIEGAGDWALRVYEAPGAEEYVNPPDGTAIFDPA